MRPSPRTIFMVVGASFAIGVGCGAGISASGRPFVLEAHNTPLGSFILHFNQNQNDSISPVPDHLKQNIWIA
jgi:hypothetical protein